MTRSSAFEVERTSVGKSSASSVPSAMPPAPAMKIDVAAMTHSGGPPVRKKIICVPVAMRERDRGDGAAAARFGQPTAEQQTDEARGPRS